MLLIHANSMIYLSYNTQASLSPEYSQMQGYVSYVLYYEDPAYSNEENSPKAQKMENLRKRFIVGMKLEKLYTQDERVGKHKFVKVFCPEERLYEEAESIGVELPLYGVCIICLNLDSLKQNYNNLVTDCVF